MWHSLGKVTVTAAGTPIRATVNLSDSAATYKAHSLLFQQVPGNTGKIYVMDRSNGVAATGIGVLAVLAIPTSNIIQSASCTVTVQMNGFNAGDFWIDADVNGEGCQVSAIVA